MEVEAASYCPLTRGAWRSKVEAFIMCGDEKQLHSIIGKATGKITVNEFRHQNTLSLFERLWRRRFFIKNTGQKVSLTTFNSF